MTLRVFEISAFIWTDINFKRVKACIKTTAIILICSILSWKQVLHKCFLFQFILVHTFLMKTLQLLYLSKYPLWPLCIRTRILWQKCSRNPVPSSWARIINWSPQDQMSTKLYKPSPLNQYSLAFLNFTKLRVSRNTHSLQDEPSGSGIWRGVLYAQANIRDKLRQKLKPHFLMWTVRGLSLFKKWSEKSRAYKRSPPEIHDSP